MSTTNNSLNINASTPLSGSDGGTGHANSGLTINLGSAATGKVLTSDSSGNATWGAANAPGLTTAAAASSTQAAAVNTIYYVTSSAACTVTLPATAAAGSIVGIVGYGAGGWILAPNSGQTIKLITVSASTSVTSAEQYDTIQVMCTLANTTWVAMNYLTTGFTYV